MTTASLTSVDTEATLWRRSARAARYDALRVIWRETMHQRFAYCRRVLSDTDSGVRVMLTGEAGTPEARAGLSGVQTCGSVWACPVCSERVNAERQAELELGIRNWLGAGHAVAFGTFTLQHHKGQRLADLWDAIGPAWNRATSGAGVAWNGGKRELGDRARFGIAGQVRVVEVKHGKAGWHPHVHFLLFLESELSAQELDDLRSRMFGRWETALAKCELRAVEKVWNEDRGEWDHVGLDLRPVVDGERMADYFQKNTYGVTSPGAAAYEVTGSATKRAGKGGRTPFQLLEDLVRDGVEDDLALWMEWEKASLGRRQLTWSRGLRARLALLDERTDEEIAGDELGGEVVVEVTREQWKGGLASMQAELLAAAEAGTLAEFLADFDRDRLGVDWSRIRERPPERI